MIPELGVFCLILAVLMALLQAGGLALARLRQAIGTFARWQFFCLTLALVLLAVSRVVSDFTVTNVAEHSNLALPLIYKIAGTWGNHEGSMLLWVWVLALFGLMMARHLPAQRELLERALPVQALLGVGFLLFILLTSNPFAREFPPPKDGAALNPLLQDIGLAIHPPLLYLGYVGFSAVFSLAAGALLLGRMERGWAVFAQRWILLAWSFLTLGIALGSWWAYRELGWGGFWFWDPVENASLLPWLAGTALLHANRVTETRGTLVRWVLTLSILTFAMSLIGTFLVRSGMITSVHSFASDPARGMFILGYLALAVGGALVLYTVRAPVLESAEAAQPVSREGLIIVGNLLLVTACATVLIGTLYPMLAEWLQGRSLTVGPPYFHRTFLPLMALAVVLAAAAPFAPWGQASLRKLARTMLPSLIASAIIALCLLALVKREAVLAAGGFALSGWMLAGLARYAVRHKISGRTLGMMLAHGGAALLVMAITAAGLGKQETQKLVTPGDAVEAGGYRFLYTGETTLEDPNYTGKRGMVQVQRGDKKLAVLYPEYRRYAIRQVQTSEASIAVDRASDLYAVLGDAGEREGTALRLYITPLMPVLWAGCLLMVAGGLAAAWRRRGKHHAL